MLILTRAIEMGLTPQNPLINFRVSFWFQIKDNGKSPLAENSAFLSNGVDSFLTRWFIWAL